MINSYEINWQLLPENMISEFTKNTENIVDIEDEENFSEVSENIENDVIKNIEVSENIENEVEVVKVKKTSKNREV